MRHRTQAAVELERANQRVRRSWAKQARRYDKSMSFFERRVFGEGHREWACSRASGDTLEVAVGTGLNLALYPQGVLPEGDRSEPRDARDRPRTDRRCCRTRRPKGGRRTPLPFADASFNAVVCTYAMCNIPDPGRAIGETKRVLRPGGKLVLVDHIRSASKPIYWLQKLIEFF